MGKKEKGAKKEKDKIDIQNNDLQKEGTASLKECKTEADVMNIQDILRHSSSSGKLGPILPSFSHAPCSVPLLAAADPHCSIEVQWKGDNPQPRLSMNIDGQEYQGTSQPCGPFTTYLAIRDTATGKTRLVEACPLVLNPQVTAPPSRNPVLLSEKPAAEGTWAENLVQQKALVKKFGRQTGARYYQKVEEMRVDGGLKEEMILKAAGNAVGLMEPATEVEQKEDGLSHLLPPRNDMAQNKEMVYEVGGLLTKIELGCLNDAAEKFFATQCDSEEAVAKLLAAKQISKFGKKLLSECLACPGDLGNKPAIVLYMEGIIRFTKLRPGERNKGPVSLQKFVPLSIGKKIFDSFGSGEKKNLTTPELLDKAICYVIVLGLLASKLQLETILLTESVFVRADHLKKLVAMVGAHMVADNQKILLKLPLAKFDINFKPRARSKGK